MSLGKSLKIGAIIQARLTSTRLPKKILMKIGKLTILQHCIQQVKKSKLLNQVIVASPHKIPLKLDVPVFIGDEYDVLKRYYDCATKYNLDIIVRITADCPFIDPEVIDIAIKYHKKHRFVYTCFAPIDGLDVEVIDYQALYTAHNNARDDYDREHVTPYIRRYTKLSVDTQHDLERAKAWYELER